MASSSTLDLPSISHVISVRLERDNYPTRLARIVPVLRGRRLLSYVDGSCPSPSPTISDPKAKESESSPPDLLRTTRGDSSIIDFLDRIHSITDNLALAGAPVHDSIFSPWL
ncbi:unnamed protein product [Prunus brigantina]